MKHLYVCILFMLSMGISLAQSLPNQPVPPLDSLARLSQRYMNSNQADSLYSLMGAGFKQQISLDKLKEVLGQLGGQVGKWTSMEPRGMEGGVARYKAVFTMMPLDFYISRDKEGKIETFLFKPLQE